MHKRTIFIAASACLAAASVMAQVKDQSSSQVISGEMGKGDIFMDKRSPEERDLCNTDGFIESGGDPKIFKDDGRASDERGGTVERDGDAFAESGGDPKIFRDGKCRYA